MRLNLLGNNWNGRKNDLIGLVIRRWKIEKYRLICKGTSLFGTEKKPKPFQLESGKWEQSGNITPGSINRTRTLIVWNGEKKCLFNHNFGNGKKWV